MHLMFDQYVSQYDMYTLDAGDLRNATGAHGFVQNEANMCPVFMDLQNRACEFKGIHHGGLLFLIEQKE